MNDDKNKNDKLVTMDVFYMAAVKALLEREPDENFIIPVSRHKKKVSSTYNDKTGLPSYSDIRIVFGDKEISLNDFKFAYFEMRDKVFDLVKERDDDDGKREETSD